MAAVKTRVWMVGLAMGGVLGRSVLVGGAWAQVQTVSGEGWAAVPVPSAAPAVTKFFPLAEVKRGMRGVAYTVFEGVNPEPMQVEILGLLKDALGPGQDMILARLHGEKPEYTGVVAGMSGSPVYIDGKLAGALSYRIGQFSKEPIAGITPIEAMLQVRDEESAPAVGMQRAEVKDTGLGISENGGISEGRGQPEIRAMET